MVLRHVVIVRNVWVLFSCTVVFGDGDVAFPFLESSSKCGDLAWVDRADGFVHATYRV